MTRRSTSPQRAWPSRWRTIVPPCSADILARAGAKGIAIFPGSGIVDVEGTKAVKAREARRRACRHRRL